MLQVEDGERMALCAPFEKRKKRGIQLGDGGTVIESSLRAK
jgi:putative IMPACT (imprinted ancient) family translation regulator